MKMSEENGKSDLNSSETTSTCRNDAGNNRQGGRIRFFKEGKFILEIKRTCEGNKYCWVSVSRNKTVWPPQDETISSSSTDDNCSTGSKETEIFPWRIHNKKQSSPLKGISKNMCFYFHNTKLHLTTVSKKSRRPFDPSTNIIVKIKAKKKTVRRCIQLQKIVQGLTDKLLPQNSHALVSPKKRSKRKELRQKLNISHMKHSCKPVEDHSLEQVRNSSSHLPLSRERRFEKSKLFQSEQRKKLNAYVQYPYSSCYSPTVHSRVGYSHPQIYSAPESNIPYLFRSPDLTKTDFTDMPLNLSKHTI